MRVMRDRCAIAVMAKAPLAGSAKTRLVPPLTHEQAAELSGAFLADITANIAEAARRAPVDGWIAYAPEGAEHAFASHAAPGTRLLLADGAGEMPDGVAALGRSLLHAMRGLLARGYGAVCLVNSDSPTLPTAILVRAAALLLADPAQVVLGPAEDGGYYLVGMTTAHADLFRDIPWSTAAVADTTRTRAAEAGLRLTEFQPWHDVDDPASLLRVAAELAAQATGSPLPLGEGARGRGPQGTPSPPGTPFPTPSPKGRGDSVEHHQPFPSPATSALLVRLGLLQNRVAAE